MSYHFHDIVNTVVTGVDAETPIGMQDLDDDPDIRGPFFQGELGPKVEYFLIVATGKTSP